ncbi:MAG TPA: M48 family metalloprotease [bacterium]|jgi:predicted Zn-dependent protease|nr:M48 family metalloprotease [bacterium]
MSAFKKMLLGLGACAGLALLSSCAAVGGAMQLAGTMTGDQGLSNTGASFKRAAQVQEFSDEEKMYTGRTVAANLLAQSKLSQNLDLERYVGKVGQTVAQASQKPDLPQGWHFVLLDDHEVGAYSTPGGIVMVEEDLVRLCRDEDELAGVLAHEVSHVALDHPMQAISASNQKAAFESLANWGYAKASQGSDLSSLQDQFKNVTADVGEAVGHGYDRDKENAADMEAVRICAQLGYDPRGLARVLRRLKSGDKSHGDPAARAAAVDQACAALQNPPQPLPARSARFLAALR